MLDTFWTKGHYMFYGLCTHRLAHYCYKANRSTTKLYCSNNALRIQLYGILRIPKIGGYWPERHIIIRPKSSLQCYLLPYFRGNYLDLFVLCNDDNLSTCECFTKMCSYFDELAKYLHRCCQLSDRHKWDYFQRADWHAHVVHM